MKKILLWIAIIIPILSSCKSKEEKATEMIKNEMFKTLYDFESYQPIETKVDSAYTSIYTDSTIISHAYIARHFLDDVDKQLEEIKDAKSTMEIWGDGYSSLSRTKFNNAYEKYTEALDKAKAYIEIANLQMDTIKQLSKKFEPKFYGWKATHKFRCKTKGGNPDIGNYIYVFDEKMKNIIYQENQDDESLPKIKNLIDEAINKEDSLATE